MKNKYWKLLMNVLWVYSLLIMMFTLAAVFFFPPLPVDYPAFDKEARMGGLMFLPVFLYLVLQGFERFHDNTH